MRGGDQITWFGYVASYETTYKMNCVFVSSFTCFGRSAIGGIRVGWFDRIWAARADPN
jgi:hypothetical protein